VRKELIVSIKEQANQEIVDAYNYYQSKQVGLGEYFLNDLSNTISAIKLSPNGFVKFHQYRQVRFSVFPFVIVFEVVKNELLVYAVFETHQNPSKKFR
jgi:hypothetical protein